MASPSSTTNTSTDFITPPVSPLTAKEKKKIAANLRPLDVAPVATPVTPSVSLSPPSTATSTSNGSYTTPAKSNQDRRTELINRLHELRIETGLEKETSSRDRVIERERDRDRERDREREASPPPPPIKTSLGTTERAIRTRSGISEFNPIYMYNLNVQTKGEVAIHSIVGGPHGPTANLLSFIKYRPEAFRQYSGCVSRLFLRRESPSGIEIDVGTAVKVGPNRWLTTLHNMSKVFEIDCTTDFYAPRLAYRAVTNFWVATPLLPLDRTTNPKDDVDPINHYEWNTKSDYVFLKHLDGSREGLFFTQDSSDDNFLIPDPTPLTEGEPICLIAYHHPPFFSYLEETYSIPVPSVAHMNELFVNFEIKAVSPGKVLKVGDGGIFAHDCSSMHGATGGLLFRMDPNGHPLSFCGIHIGSWRDTSLNHSLGLSVNHGGFVVDYVKNVLPKLIPTKAQTSEAIQTYIRQHEQHLKSHGADALRMYKQVLHGLIFKDK